MKRFEIYRHPNTSSLEAVKIGFSWPAFFFNGIWAFVKGLPVQGFFLVVLSLVLNVGSRVSGEPEMVWLASFLGLWISAGVGSVGNDWLRKKLRRQGYRHFMTREARSAEDALAAVKENGAAAARLA